MINNFKDRALSSDFWWLSPEEAIQYRFIYLFHQEPYSDEPETDRDPRSCPLLQSETIHRLDDTSDWKVEFRNINIFRSYALYKSDTIGEEMIGPFLLDIDRTDSGYQPDLKKALYDTQILIREYCSNFREDDYRIFFTGHKGFNIEIHPRVFGLSSKVERRRRFKQELRKINKIYGEGFVDPLHEHIRFHYSINSWIHYSGVQDYAIKYQISKKQLVTKRAEDMLNKARKLDLPELQQH